MNTESKQNEKKDRRIKQRFAIHRELKYKVLEDGAVVEAGVGYSLDIGSGGVAFSVDRPMRPDTFIELSISWPVLLDDACPMRFIVFGRVLRNTGCLAVCSVDKYEFRTQARTFQAVAPVVRTDSMLQRWADGLRRESARPRVMTAVS